MNNLLIKDFKGQAVVNSRQVAQNFEVTSKMFIESDYKDIMNRTQREYLLTQGGFTLLAMGFTGAKTLQFKLKYIKSFNEMEQQLHKPKFQTPQTYAEALRQLADSTETNEKVVVKKIW